MERVIPWEGLGGNHGAYDYQVGGVGSTGGKQYPNSRWLVQA